MRLFITLLILLIHTLYASANTYGASVRYVDDYNNFHNRNGHHQYVGSKRHTTRQFLPPSPPHFAPPPPIVPPPPPRNLVKESTSVVSYTMNGKKYITTRKYLAPPPPPIAPPPPPRNPHFGQTQRNSRIYINI